MEEWCSVLDIRKQKLIELYTKSNRNKQTLDLFFNPSRGCFGCMIVSELTLEQACKNFRIDIDALIQRLS